MLQPKKLKYQLLKEQFFMDEIEFLTNTYNRFRTDEIKRFQKKSRKKSNYYTSNNSFNDQNTTSYELILSSFYDNLFHTFFEKTNEDLFLSFWKEKDTLSLNHKKEFYRLMGASDMLDSCKKSFGKYFVLYKFVISKKCQNKQISSNKKYYFNTVKNMYYLTLDEIKNKFNFLSNEDFLLEVNKLTNNENINEIK